ncbi:MAG: helix-turn-helix transcriptional regulator [Oscillospiraceae bacterium]|nr:helix-turn-helix transcriptional regulator [Oscillospiraceae bacterium]
MNFNEKLVALRKDAGMSQDALAEKLGVTRQAISKWELGTAMPETKSIVQIAQVFGVTTDYLLGYTAVEYHDLKKQFKSNADKILLVLYVIVTLLFLFCSMKTIVCFARKLTWTIRPLSYTPFKEWKKIAWLSGIHHFETGAVFLFFAITAYIAKFFIRKFSKGENK